MLTLRKRGFSDLSRVSCRLDGFPLWVMFPMVGSTERVSREGEMLNFRFRGILKTSFLWLFFMDILFFAGQSVSVTADENGIVSDTNDPYIITVDVEEIRLDVVVVDGSGRQITDLTVDDFEVYQNNRPQVVKSSIYINDAPEVASPPVVSKPLPNLPPATLKNEDVRRSILFMVDNLSTDFEHMHWARMSMRRFVNEQMQSGDMVSIMQTDNGNSLMDMFHADKRALLQRIKNINHNVSSMMHRVYNSQLTALSYGISALENMPGRKILIFLTAMPNLSNPKYRIANEGGFVRNTDRPENYYEIYRDGFSQLADEALRAGVVVHFMDVRGLEHLSRSENANESEMEGQAQEDESLVDALNPLPVKTGGLIIADRNFFIKGLGDEVNNVIAGHYLVTYIPPPDTYELNWSGSTAYNRVKIRVKRKGAKVHTRDGFYGIADSETKPAEPENLLQDAFYSSFTRLKDAVFSPFAHSGIKVNMTAGYTGDTKAGYLIRSWTHIDAKDVTMVETEKGARIAIGVVYLTSTLGSFPVKPTVHDSRFVNHVLDIERHDIDRVKKHGIRFFTVLPIKKSGFYTVRVAVSDTESGRTGAAWQYVEIFDLGKKDMALSDMFVITNNDDLMWMSGDVIKELDRGMFFSVTQEGDIRTPALRTYMPGDNLQTLTMLYNANAKAIARSEIEIQTILYKDGEEFLRGTPKPISPNQIDKAGVIPILQTVKLGSDMSPGSYTLQLLVVDSKNYKVQTQGLLSKIILVHYLGDDKKEDVIKGVVSQALHFTIADGPEEAGSEENRTR